MQHFICNISEADISIVQLIVYLKRLSLKFEYGQGVSKYKYRHLGAEILLSYFSMQSTKWGVNGEHWISQKYSCLF